VNATELNAQIDQRNAEATALVKLWKSLLPVECSEFQFHIWLDRHNFANVVRGIRETAKKFQKLNGQMDLEYCVRFASKCMNSHRTIYTEG
jgi:hypothetical protein